MFRPRDYRMKCLLIEGWALRRPAKIVVNQEA